MWAQVRVGIFLTGSEASVKKLTDQLGFKFKWIESSKEYSHPSVAYAISPAGVVSRNLNGIEFNKQTLSLAVLEAGKGKVGNFIDRFVLFCFQFDPSKNKYTLYAYNIMRIGAALTVFALGIVLVPYWLRQKGVS